MTTVEEAEAVVQKLEQAQRQLAHRGIELAEERQRIAFSAHTGDAKARARLDKINTETAGHASEVAGIEAALVEAGKRVSAARSAAALVADRENAVKARELFEKFCELGREVDLALQDAAGNATEMEQVLNELHALGETRPTTEQLRALGSLAVLTALGKTPWKGNFEMLAPSQRRTFSSLVDQWSANVMPGIEARIGDSKQQEAA